MATPCITIESVGSVLYVNCPPVYRISDLSSPTGARCMHEMSAGSECSYDKLIPYGFLVILNSRHGVFVGMVIKLSGQGPPVYRISDLSSPTGARCMHEMSAGSECSYDKLIPYGFLVILNSRHGVFVGMVIKLSGQVTHTNHGYGPELI